MQVTQNIDVMVAEVKEFLLSLQDRLCASLEHQDGSAKFHEDSWQHANNKGGGRTRVIANGDVIEQGGVNFSHVCGDSLPAAATAHRPDLVGASFQALGISSVIHPLNPYAPTAHMNVRLFAAQKSDGEVVWWIGGGYDLTPYYGFDEDCQHFHRTAKFACDEIDPLLYAQFKKEADDYFYLKHRNEPRGIGGIFYDDFNKYDFETCFRFMRNVGNSFIDAYVPIVERRKNTPYEQRQRDFQCYRRGRYVEFNLVYDRGTKFGLQFGGRIESILMSLPPHVNWRYNWHPEPGSEEAQLYDRYLVPRDWQA